MSAETSEANPMAYTTQISGSNDHLVASGVGRQLNLKHLVNLALSSSPKAGVVNFNLLKVFLLELLKALDLQNHEFKLDPNTLESSTAALLENEITASALDAANQSFHVNNSYSVFPILVIC